MPESCCELATFAVVVGAGGGVVVVPTLDCTFAVVVGAGGGVEVVATLGCTVDDVPGALADWDFAPVETACAAWI